MCMPALETERLLIRSFSMDDLEEAHRILDLDLSPAAAGEHPPTLAGREAWLRWTVMGYEENAKLHNPPYGDRAVILKDGGRLIGACGLVPLLAPFGLLPSLGGETDPDTARFTPEVGLFYAFAPEQHGRGYATEAARALVDFAFRELRLRRVVAMTTHDNPRSAAVMRRAGMRVETNPHAHPEWLQVVGFIENPMAV